MSAVEPITTTVVADGRFQGLWAKPSYFL